MAKARNYRKEYRARTADRTIPVAYRRGHRPAGMPSLTVVRQLEAGTLSPSERMAHIDQITRYEDRYGPGGSGRQPTAGRKISRTVKTRQEAEDEAEQGDVPEGYYDVRRSGSGWAVYQLRGSGWKRPPRSRSATS